MTLTLHQSYTQLSVGTSNECYPGDSWGACQRDIAQGTKVPHNGPTEVPVRLDAGRHKDVPVVQMTGMRSILIPGPQLGSGTSRLGGGSNVG
jgi:urease beta subunit